MSAEAGLLQALHEEPTDWTHWLVLADWLEDNAEPARAELMRLYVEMRRTPWGKIEQKKKTRMLGLLAKGARPYLPSITNSIGMVFVLIPPGTFMMGSQPREKGRFADENNIHEVGLTQPFYLGIHPVTQGQYRAITRTNPSAFSSDGTFADRVTAFETDTLPVEQISWENARDFCKKLSSRAAEKRAGRSYRLPSEAEWEYACRAGISSQPFFLRGSARLKDFNFGGEDDESEEEGLNRTSHVGSYPPNAFGLHDMHGNVWDWCNDGWDSQYYLNSPRVDPPGGDDPAQKVFRGGAWRSWPSICRAACRSADDADFSDDYTGMRAVLCWTRNLALTGPL